ncbi:hypothetical protein [Silvimonas sp.]|uniref:hypothetical protein n=1 Tax=Silvimonas sp. TaxID=2650811 RepID=UPI00284D2A6D|nr:hypothetical protein [Silvimonas sp.]MDR3427734.1 hypothetical protein [Silvimonas sp.]
MVELEAGRSIIEDMRRLRPRPFTNIHHSFREAFEKQIPQLPSGRQGRARLLLQMLEFFLQVTNRNLTLNNKNNESCDLTINLFVAAINSKKFFNFSDQTARNYSNLFSEIIHSISRENPSTLLPNSQKIAKDKQSLSVHLASHLDKIPLNEEKVRLWRSWFAYNKKGARINLDLYGVFLRLGQTSTEVLYKIAANYAKERGASRIPCFRELCSFIEITNIKISASYLQDSFGARQFLNAFFLFYNNEKINNAAIMSKKKNWNNLFVLFVNDFLILGGWIAKPFGKIPQYNMNGRHLDPGPSVQKIKSIEQNQKTYDFGLITPIPACINSSIHIDLLYRQASAELETIRAWANGMIEEIWARYKNYTYSVEFSLSDLTGKRQVHEPHRNSHPAWDIKYFISPIKFREYRTILTRTNLNALHPYVVGLPILPTPYTLLPFMAALVIKNPWITSSIIEGFELFNEKGQLVGLTIIDGKFILRGQKERKGPQNAIVKNEASAETAEIVRKLISITEIYRKYLKVRNNDDWRYLFLKAKNHSRPTRTTRIVSVRKNAEARKNFETDLMRHGNIAGEVAKNLAQRFSPQKLRKQSALVSYLETRNLCATSALLGHLNYNPDLINRYIPQAIIDFFRVHDIVAFQECIVVQAMLVSPHFEAATGLKSSQEISAFLAANCNIDFSRLNFNRENTDTPKGQLLITVSPEAVDTFALMIRKNNNNKNKEPSGIISYWVDFGRKLFSVILENKNKNPELFELITNAQNLAGETSQGQS